eukprot:m.631957 g.631957  ORF g.631957 m.631957 type:complete len:631 (-) comp58288_c0_seq1:133-2025(-)
MLDMCSVVTLGGIVLWAYTDEFSRANSNALNELISAAIIQKRGNEEAYVVDQQALRFLLDPVHRIVVVAAYPRGLEAQLQYVPKLLASIQQSFVATYAGELQSGRVTGYAFKPTFDEIRKQVLAEAKQAPARTMRTFEESTKDKNSGKTVNDTATTTPIVVGKSPVGKPSPVNTKAASKPSSGPPSPTKPVKKAKVLAPSTRPSVLNFSPDEPTDQQQPVLSPAEQGIQSLQGDVPDYEYTGGDDVIDDPADEPADDTTAKPAPSGGVFSFFKSLTSGTTINSEALAPVLEQMRLHLCEKNVAQDIAQKLVESVGASLQGQTKSSFTRIATIVRDTLTKTLTSLLTPNRRVDILRDVIAAKAQKEPYSICFCGVNGVGKSTNLAKITYWLLQNDMRVLIAACDTFRAGAVEQLRTHRNKLSALHEGSDRVVLYEKGYGKDPAAIAHDAIAFAREQGFDVVLIDTAGRMQDNEPLMRALTKLIAMNTPNLVLFVGEALVGNEAVDQLVKFNKALQDFSHQDHPRTIDGIVLTKFDTIDDKVPVDDTRANLSLLPFISLLPFLPSSYPLVFSCCGPDFLFSRVFSLLSFQVGAAISMTYTTGQPIVFVGTGQSYHDLKKLNVQAVVSALMSA